MSKLNLKEAKIKKRIEEKLEKFWRNPRYKEQFEGLENSPIKHRISDNEYYVLGELFEKYDEYNKFVNENGNVNDLGILPNVALDIITTSFASSIIPLVCSVQTIDEVNSTIYFKNVKASTTRGNVTDGDSLIKVREKPDVYPVGFAGEENEEVLFSTTAGTLTYAGIVGIIPVRPRTVVVEVPDLNLKAIDDGLGALLGNGLYGTIDYNTGNYSITFVNDPGNNHNTVMKYGTDFEESGQIPKITMFLDDTQITAQIFVLGSDVGLFKAYSLQKRFGRKAENDVVNDLTEAITAEVGNTIIQKIETSVPGTALQWDRTPPAGVSWQDHRFELIQMVNELEAKIYNQLGRGIVNVMIAGSKACAVLASLPNFKKSGLTGIGAHLYGTLDGNIDVIRAPQLSDPYKVYPLYKGNGYFDAPVVYAPYMPLFVTGSIPSPDNILKHVGLAAVWAGVKVVVPNMITHLQIIQT